MRKFIILGIALVALVVPTAAMAVVAVDNGVGFVGKGDVQDALDLANDEAMQKLFKLQPNGAAIKFTTSYDLVLDNTIQCGTYAFVDGKFTIVKSGTFHKINTTPVTQAVKATANTNAAGKLTNGWNLTGFDGPVTYGPITTVIDGACPTGSSDIGTASQVPTETAPSLKVNGFDLPNTPAPVVEPVA